MTDDKLKRFPLSAVVYFRPSTQEWVLELQGAINDVGMTSRHTQPADTKPEDVPGLRTLYPTGYIFHNPDTGIEYSENHPIESGEVPDAENIREATLDELKSELLDAWKALEEATLEKETLAKKLISLEEEAKRMPAKLTSLEFSQTKND